MASVANSSGISGGVVGEDADSASAMRARARAVLALPSEWGAPRARLLRAESIALCEASDARAAVAAVGEATSSSAAGAGSTAARDSLPLIALEVSALSGAPPSALQRAIDVAEARAAGYVDWHVQRRMLSRSHRRKGRQGGDARPPLTHEGGTPRPAPSSPSPMTMPSSFAAAFAPLQAATLSLADFLNMGARTAPPPPHTILGGGGGGVGGGSVPMLRSSSRESFESSPSGVGGSDAHSAAPSHVERARTVRSANQVRYGGVVMMRGVKDAAAAARALVFK